MCLIGNESRGMAARVEPVCEDALAQCLRVIRESFATVAADFGLTRENCPGHTAFLTRERLTEEWKTGELMFALYEGAALVGFMALAEREQGEWELKRLAVLPTYRRKGYGGMLLAYAKEKTRLLGGKGLSVGIIEENERLKAWYVANGFIHMGCQRFEHLPFTVGRMTWRA